MSLVPGSRIGPYEVLASIGAGGMGEVFRARDARLKRDVAVKILAPAAVGDADRRARFEREAQVLASLNHPSIAQIFGVEIDGDTSVIVMELVDGATLAERLAHGPLAVDEAIGTAIQICQGLEAAHEQGIIHRDLKPANIKLRPDGTIKILDFGLARVLTEDVRLDPANSPTVSGHTAFGVLLGTAAYMSPEQARGQAVDRRADIWAFGCVLFEMLTGLRAFEGGSTTDILAAVVQQEPEWPRLPARTPDRVLELLRRCLQKNPRDRLRDIADARFQLEQAHLAGGNPSEATSTRPPATPRAPGWRAAAWFVAGAAAAAAVAILAPAFGRRTAAPPAPARAAVTLPADTTLSLARGAAVALSPDGRTLVYTATSAGQTQLYVRPLDRFDASPLAGTEGAANPFFSPDGRWVGFLAGTRLKKVAIDGGAPVTIAEVPLLRGQVWAEDNNILITPMNNVGISRVPAVGGQRQPVTSLRSGELSHRWPDLLPGGGAIIYTVWNDLGWEPARIAARPLAGGEPRLVIEAGGGHARYIRDGGQRGYLVYARSEGLLAAPFDEARLAVTGQPTPVVDSVVTNLSGGAHFALSASGTLAYVPGTIGEIDRDLVWATLDGKTTPAVRVQAMSRGWALSADGRRVVRHNTVGASRDIWIEDLENATSTRLPNSTVALNTETVWSKDGKWVAFARGEPPSLYRRFIDREADERLTTATKFQSPNDVSPDGKWLTYVEFDPVTGPDIWVVPVSAGQPGDAQPRPMVKSNFVDTDAAFSPDGKWLAYQSNDSGRFQVFVRSFPDGQRIVRVSTDGGLRPVWSASGTEIYYRSLDNKLMAVAVETGNDARASKPRVLFDAASYETFYAAAPDGKRLLMLRLVPEERAATHIHIVFNFLSELRQRVR